jgi:hypothetical protein
MGDGSQRKDWIWHKDDKGNLQLNQWIRKFARFVAFVAAIAGVFFWLAPSMFAKLICAMHPLNIGYWEALFGYYPIAESGWPQTVIVLALITSVTIILLALLQAISRFFRDD